MKIFCIGLNKTGTTSLEHLLFHLGHRMGNQPAAEMLLEDWAKRDFTRLIALCQTADAFQDIPFSLPFTFQALDIAFPGSKFILTVRDSAEQWYSSLTRFHAKIIGKGRLPTGDDLRAFTYRYRGFLWRYHELVHGTTDATVYDKQQYMLHYVLHNQTVMQYFRYRKGDLLVLNVKQPDASQRVCAFLGIEYNGLQMPAVNKT